MSTFIVFFVLMAIICFVLKKLLPGPVDETMYDLPKEKLDAYNLARKMTIFGIVIAAGVPALLIFTLFVWNNMSFIAQ